MRWMTTVLVKVLMGVRWLGVKLCHQAVAVTFDFSVEECDILPGPLGSERE